MYRCLTIATQLQGVASLPAGAAGATDGQVEAVALAQATALLARGRQAAHLPVFVHGLRDPLGVGVAPDGLVEGVDEDHLEELVGGVLAHPVAVQDPQATAVTASTLLVDHSDISVTKFLDDQTGFSCAVIILYGPTFSLPSNKSIFF